MVTIEKPAVKKRQFNDGRVFLKVKLKSLAAESRIIRTEERRSRSDELRNSLREHRRGIVRNEARHTLIAYAFIRGFYYRDVEPTCHTPPDWAKVEAMVKKYGVVHSSTLPRNQWAKINADTFARFQAWKLA